MAQFVFTARDATGRTLTRTLEADSAQTIIDALQSEGMLVVRIRERSDPAWMKRMRRMTPIGLKLLTIFSRQFSLLVSSGLTMARALSTLEEQTSYAPFKDILSSLRKSVQSGETLHRSMGEHKRAFSPFFRSMVRAGEVGGVLEEVLERMATFFEKELRLRHKIKAATAYPIFVLIMAFIITMGILVFIVPQFAQFFEEISEGKQPLPALTQTLRDASDFIMVHGWWVIPTPFVLGILFGMFRKTKWGHIILDPIIIRLPIFGKLSKMVGVSRFTRTLGTLIQSGVTMLESLEVTKTTADNIVLERAVDYIRDRVREGEAMSLPMKRSRIFPPMVYNMVAVGEEGGNLELMLHKIADFYDEEVDAMVEALASLIEPLMIVVIGIIVGVIVVALYLPVFSVVDLF
ncbi:type II secretion system F family protein [bacterium]|nr:type II secretion system F family protein [bacterium]